MTRFDPFEWATDIDVSDTKAIARSIFLVACFGALLFAMVVAFFWVFVLPFPWGLAWAGVLLAVPVRLFLRWLFSEDA